MLDLIFNANLEEISKNLEKINKKNAQKIIVDEVLNVLSI